MLDVLRTLPGLMDKLPHAEAREAVVFALWRSIVGEQLFEKTLPVRLDGTTLVVAIAGVSWKKHLEALSGQMIYKLNAALGRSTIELINFRVDEKAVKNARSKHSDEVSDVEIERAIKAEIPAELKEAALKISDGELRERFLMAAGGCLLRKKFRNSN